MADEGDVQNCAVGTKQAEADAALGLAGQNAVIAHQCGGTLGGRGTDFLAHLLQPLREGNTVYDGYDHAGPNAGAGGFRVWIHGDDYRIAVQLANRNTRRRGLRLVRALPLLGRSETGVRVVQLAGHFFQQRVEGLVGDCRGHPGPIALAQGLPVNAVEAGIVIALVHHLPDLVEQLQALLGRE